MRIILTISFLLLATPALATTWYVRSDGGTSTQCTGLADAAYDGSGSGEACAVKNLSYIISNNGTVLLQGGDTVYLDKTTSVTQYKFAYNTDGIVNGGNGGICTGSGSEFACRSATIPSGPSAGNPTKIIGKGGETGCSNFGPGTMTQIWGSDRVGPLLTIGGNDNIEISCIELTDHSACIENGPLNAGNIDGFPVHCQRDTSPFGAWSAIAIEATEGANNITLKDVYIHGMAAKAIFAARIEDFILDHVLIIGNGYTGWDGDPYAYTCTGPGTCSSHYNDETACEADVNGCLYDDNSNTGEVQIKNGSKVAWNGCGERYPLQNSSDLIDTDNFHHCWSQQQGGFGDGIGLGNGETGDWTITDSEVSWNTSDGVDLLHGSGTEGIVKFIRSRAEGNAGNQFKSAVLETYIENSILIGNCGFFDGQSFTATTNNFNGNTTDFDNCRASGAAIAYQVNPGTSMYIKSSTILGNGDTIIQSSGESCDGTESLKVDNSIIRGGTEFNDGSDLADFYFPSGRYPDGLGPCQFLPAIDVDHSLVYGTKALGSDTDCSGGTGNLCNVDPEFTGTILQGPGTYYTTPDYFEQVTLSPSSPAVAAADETVSCNSDCSEDIDETARGVQWDMGAYEVEAGVAPPVLKGKFIYY